MRRRNYERESYPQDDKILQNKTLGQIHAAFDIIERPAVSPLESYYLKLMADDEEYTTTPGMIARVSDWLPIEELRWTPIKCTHIMLGSTMLVFTAVDVFTVMSCTVRLERTERIFYGIQSLLARENAAYFLAYTANPTARRPSWRLRALGGHKIADGLPIVLGPTSSFSGRARVGFERLNPLPQLQAIPAEQNNLHDFVVQILTGNLASTQTGSHRAPIMYQGNRITNDNDPPPVQRDNRQGGVRVPRQVNPVTERRVRRVMAAQDQQTGQAINPMNQATNTNPPF